MSKSAPNFNIPPSSATVSVRIIDTTTHISGIPLSGFVAPAIRGHTPFSIPAYSFLIEHPSSRSLLFDLGVRRDWENLAPSITKRIKDGGWEVIVQKGVREQLEEHGVSVANIEAIIWSHWHWDHTGDPSTFDEFTALIVGPGFKQSFALGYPSNKSSPILESNYTGRELCEISFDSGLKIGRCNAFDYFEDGSFYLLGSPDHAAGHMCALARVTTNPNSYIYSWEVTHATKEGNLDLRLIIHFLPRSHQIPFRIAAQAVQAHCSSLFFVMMIERNVFTP